MEVFINGNKLALILEPNTTRIDLPIKIYKT